MFADHSHIIAVNPSAMYSGIAVADVDGDEQYEFFICNESGSNRVLKWTGSGLRDMASPILADPLRHAIGVVAADVDGDGREELYVLNSDSQQKNARHADRLFDQSPDGSWFDHFQHSHNRRLQNRASRGVVVVDRRGTGRYGFCVTNNDGPMRYYEMSQNGHLTDVASALGMDQIAGAQGIWSGPLLSSHMDIVCVNHYGPNRLWANTGSGRFANVASPSDISGEECRGIVALDANDDGRFDLCWSNREGPHRLMIREAGFRFRDRASPAMAYPGPLGTIVAADFDNDGHEELFFGSYGEPNRLFGPNAASPSDWDMLDAGAAMEPNSFCTGAAVADVDGDGRLELLISHSGSSGRGLSLYRGPVNNNHWLRIRPLTRHGAPARGASVTLNAGGKRQIRAIDAGSGFCCQMEPVAHFGLGHHSQVDTVTITWPDGSALTLENPGLRKTLTVPYPNW